MARGAALADVPLGEFQNALLPGTMADDRGVMLGGIGSGLFALGGSESHADELEAGMAQTLARLKAAVEG